MSDDSHVAEKPGRLILPSLIVSSFPLTPPGILTGLLLVDIALTFECPVGVMGQALTPSSVVGVVSALFMGVLSIRFRHRSLLMAGLLFGSASALGCGFAPNLAAMILSYSLSGLAGAMAGPMATTLIGEILPLEKRARAIGWISAGGALAYVIGAPVISLIAGFGGWRLAFLGFILPVSLASLLLALTGLPSASSTHDQIAGGRTYLEGFRAVLSNRSADACLVSTALSVASFQAVGTYVSSFFRQRFLASTGFASILLLFGALAYILGSVIAGLSVKSAGRKTLTVLAALIAGAFTISYANVPSLWASMALAVLVGLFSGVRDTAVSSLTLEQVPAFRGTTMSINSAAMSMGFGLGAGVGGVMLFTFGYEGMAVSLGAMGIASAAVIHLLAIDPTRTNAD